MLWSFKFGGYKIWQIFAKKVKLFKEKIASFWNGIMLSQQKLDLFLQKNFFIYKCFEKSY